MAMDLKEAARAAGSSSTPSSEDRIERLYRQLAAVRDGRLPSPRTLKLIAGGAPKMAQKLIEEAGEVAIDAVRGERRGVIHESTDLLYHLAALWSELGITPADVWAEMDRRETALGIAEKLPK